MGLRSMIAERQLSNKPPYAAHDPAELMIASSTQLATQVPKGLTRGEAMAAGYAAWNNLRLGTHRPKKALQTGKKVRYTVASSNIGVTAQTIPDYNGLSANIADNNAFKADAGMFTAVTSVVNVTAGGGELYTAASFTQDIQGLTVTAAPASGDIMEVTGSYLPYQGQFDMAPTIGGATSALIFELMGTFCVFATTDGTGGSHDTQGYLDMPLINKLPMPEQGNLRNTNFGGGALSDVGTQVGSGMSPRTRENIPIKLLRNLASLPSPFIPGITFYLTSGSAVTTGRGARQTSPQFGFSVPTFVTVQANYLTGIAALVRVADCQQDNATFVPGRLFLFVSTTVNTSSANPPTLNTQATLSACDVYALDGNPDCFEGMVVAA